MDIEIKIKKKKIEAFKKGNGVSIDYIDVPEEFQRKKKIIWHSLYLCPYEKVTKMS